ncbi:nucleoside diphosphate kinase 7-like isoform X2 [Spodoptera litura]|uniref:Nucleoside diphosphate kinase 7-like isoform X2 n=1 Tax=Spodoptera litura TaxID=69820 RepID=A0A9J7E2M9_SPOLT|nr:nucleoside diphosphate kinase 7-like isoform X2 [Spodoptera litura]
MVFDYFDKYTFLCEIFDEDADIIVELVLNFFPFDNSCQVINPKKGKSLLRRVQLPTLKREMLQIGNIVNVFSKLLLITDCTPLTKRTLFSKVESTFAMIKPMSSNKHGTIITFIMKKGFRIVRMKNGKISKDFATKLYKHMVGEGMLPIIIDYVTSGEVIGLELVGPNAIAEWRRCLGATDPADAEPGTLRQIFGENILRNAAHGCISVNDAAEMLDLYFGYENGVPRIPFRATYENCTCCVIKPHVLLDGNVGAVLEQITATGKFHITAMAMFSVEIADAQEFYEIYKGVLPAFEGMCIHLAEGKCVVLEIQCIDPNLNCVSEFRQLAGPRDPGLCRQLYPNSIRALYGKTSIQNAIHCTDLPEDGKTEVQYFFKLLAKTQFV